VAGSHGKTTTTAMIYHILQACGVSSGFMVGGQMQGTGLNAKAPSGDYFVTEADESDGSFLYLFPYVAVVTNVENDHLDHYGTLTKLQAAFQQYIEQVSAGGFAVLCGEDPALAAIGERCSGNIIWYGGKKTFDYSVQLLDVREGKIRFEFFRRGTSLGQTHLQVPGRHNVLNAAAAMATAMEMGCAPEAVLSALPSFQGTKRRFQRLGSKAGIIVIDDYAHHPTEIRATLAAARQVHPGRLLVLFQPHRFSRTRLLAEEFGVSFGQADMTVLTDVYSAGEEAEPGVSGELIYTAAKAAGTEVVYIPDKEAAVDYLLRRLAPGDMLLTLGAGDIWKSGWAVLEKL
jgi:UDP-N-acetylmuramate--alanine ligase